VTDASANRGPARRGWWGRRKKRRGFSGRSTAPGGSSGRSTAPGGSSGRSTAPGGSWGRSTAPGGSATRGPATPDRAFLQRIAWRFTVQTAAMFIAGLLALGALALVLIDRAQSADNQRALREAIADLDAITDPPTNIVVYEVNAQGSRASLQLNGRPLDAGAIARVQNGAPPQTGIAHANGRTYQLRTARRDDLTVQAGLDLNNQIAQHRRILGSLGAVTLVGTGVALVIARVIALRAIRPLGDALERQQRFVADASHELRNPLTQLHTRAQLIEREIDTERQPELAGDVARLVRSTRQMSDILDDLLASAQLQAQPQDVQRVDLAEIATDVVDSDRDRATSQQIELAVARHGGPHTVVGSPTALRRVLGSLLDNALGHTSAGGHIAVDVDTPRPDQVVCTVRDDGTGFSPATARTMFDRFARGSHGTGRRYGLGLALVREVIAAHRGTIIAESVPGRGATFTITLPRASGQFETSASNR
jgi:signal transduction histidine kinase